MTKHHINFIRNKHVLKHENCERAFFLWREESNKKHQERQSNMEKGFEEEYKERIRTWESGLSSPRSAFGGKGEENAHLKLKDVSSMFLEFYNIYIAYTNDWWSISLKRETPAPWPFYVNAWEPLELLSCTVRWQCRIFLPNIKTKGAINYIYHALVWTCTLCSIIWKLLCWASHRPRITEPSPI